jgi:hypothetical protein
MTAKGHTLHWIKPLALPETATDSLSRAGFGTSACGRFPAVRSPNGRFLACTASLPSTTARAAGRSDGQEVTQLGLPRHWRKSNMRF